MYKFVQIIIFLQAKRKECLCYFILLKRFDLFLLFSSFVLMETLNCMSKKQINVIIEFRKLEIAVYLNWTKHFKCLLFFIFYTLYIIYN